MFGSLGLGRLSQLPQPLQRSVSLVIINELLNTCGENCLFYSCMLPIGLMKYIL